MTREPKILKDGFVTLLGVDSSIKPVTLPDTLAAMAGNAVFRGGFPATRPGFTQLPLTYPSIEVAAWMEDHVFQGGLIYEPKSGPELNIVSIGGRIFSVNPNWVVTEITPTIAMTVHAFTAPAVGSNVDVFLVIPTDVAKVLEGYPVYINGEEYLVTANFGGSIEVKNISATPGVVAEGSTMTVLWPNAFNGCHAWMVQAENFVIIQDNSRPAIIFDGAKSFRADIGLNQIPTGSVMAYNQGRLWVALHGNKYVASDIVGGSSGTAIYGNLDAILYFKENTYIAGGGSFSVPYQAGEITAMIGLPVLDSSTGNGPLLIFTENGAFANNAPVDRTTWQSLTSPIQTVVLTQGGALSFYGTITGTNGDVFYRADDGLRSFFLAIREFRDSWGSTPISSELTTILESENDMLLAWASAIVFDNRLWITVQPQPWPNQVCGAYFRGLATMDFHPINNMRTKAPPSYDGVHSGLRPTQLMVGKMNGLKRAFCWSLNGDNKNELWEISKDNPFDNTDGRITSFLETKAYVKSNPFELRNLFSGEIYVDDVRGVVDFTLFYRPDQYACWLEWGRDQSVCANWRDCLQDNELCTIPVTYRPGYKTRLNFGQPPDVDVDVDDKPGRLGYDFQFRLEWTGHCRIRKLIARFSEVDEEASPTVA